MSEKTQRTWSGWATVEELADYWKITKRRVQQILSELRKEYKVDQAILVLNDTFFVSSSKPVYKITTWHKQQSKRIQAEIAKKGEYIAKEEEVSNSRSD